ncbi:hypothetical protein SAMN05421823_106191 [Catalinimonas alkaloidigena]|uniref:Uncharacterized protein n=1 Tax=Catalinimonas alkaloidigena TaxID=1075417 RepID=A0A1G9KL97_9BACT|nr:hypothetical protein [Catalinimonas alkaloidigena]SDL50287.1 hypothetical protein SAMN05421823_106191 [Catalinimonas alkaloidigena]
MKWILILVSMVGLLLTIVPSILVASGAMTLEQNRLYMAIGTALWFLTCPFWMSAQKNEELKETPQI